MRRLEQGEAANEELEEEQAVQVVPSEGLYNGMSL